MRNFKELGDGFRTILEKSLDEAPSEDQCTIAMKMIDVQFAIYFLEEVHAIRKELETIASRLSSRGPR